MEALIPYFEGQDDHTGLVRVLRLQARCHWTSGDCAGTQRRLEQALPHSLATPRRRDLGPILSTLSAALYLGPAPVSEALARCQELADVAPDDRMAAANILIRVAGLEALRGETSEAQRLAQESRDELSDLGQALALAAASIDRATIFDLAGDQEAAEGELREGLAMLSDMGETRSRATAAARLAATLYDIGRVDEVGELLDTADSDGGADPTIAAEAHSVRAHLAADEGRADEAARLIEEARRAAAVTDMPVLKGMVELNAARVLSKLGWASGAQEAAERARESFASKGAVVLEERVRGLTGAADPV
jgi:ATP/maltotriose-dependent transcriptional regulator MalT